LATPLHVATAASWSIRRTLRLSAVKALQDQPGIRPGQVETRPGQVVRQIRSPDRLRAACRCRTAVRAGHEARLPIWIGPTWDSATSSSATIGMYSDKAEQWSR
jgi:hypothetical protein